jgi:adenosylcobinamide-GDP ribazoletransferase
VSYRDEGVGAFMLLTRLPVARLSRSEVPPAACVWAYPLVGAVVGGIGAAVFAVAGLGLPPVTAAILAVAATILASGGLHEDGLADTADGFGGGRTAARKLEIMRDSRIGSFGALALMLSLALRITAVASLARPGPAALALIMAGAFGRGAMLLPLWRLRPARPDGLGAALAMTSPRRLGIGLAITAAFALPAPIVLVAALVAGPVMTTLARRHIGGYTGDVLGATEQLAECAVLAALLMVWGA